MCIDNLAPFITNYFLQNWKQDLNNNKGWIDEGLVKTCYTDSSTDMAYLTSLAQREQYHDKLIAWSVGYT